MVVIRIHDLLEVLVNDLQKHTPPFTPSTSSAVKKCASLHTHLPVMDIAIETICLYDEMLR